MADDADDLLVTGDLGGNRGGFLGVAELVHPDDLDLGAVDAAGLVDFLDLHLDAGLDVVAIGGGGAGEGRSASDLNGFCKCGSTHQRQHAGQQKSFPPSVPHVDSSTKVGMRGQAPRGMPNNPDAKGGKDPRVRPVGIGNSKQFFCHAGAGLSNLSSIIFPFFPGPEVAQRHELGPGASNAQ